MKYPYFREFRIILQNRHTPELGCSNMFGWQCFVVLPEGGVFHWSEREKIGQHSSINCPKVGLSFEAFTYLFGWNISTHLLSAYKSSSADLLKSRVMGNFGSIRDSTNLTRSIKNLVRVLTAGPHQGLFKWMDWVPESWINSKLRVTPDFKRSVEEFSFAERRGVEIFRPHRYLNASYNWPIWEQFIGACCPIIATFKRACKSLTIWITLDFGVSSFQQVLWSLLQIRDRLCNCIYK